MKKVAHLLLSLLAISCVTNNPKESESTTEISVLSESISEEQPLDIYVLEAYGGVPDCCSPIDVEGLGWHVVARLIEDERTVFGDGGQWQNNGSKDHVYAAMCVNVGQIEGNANYKAAFCATKDGLKCVNCLWLDEHNYTEKDTDGNTIHAKLPTRPEVPAVADNDHDNYYYSTIDTETIAAAFKKMIEVRHCRYDNDKFGLRWGYIDGENMGWKYWTAAWTGEAIWNSTNTLDIDFNSLIDVQIEEY